MKIYSQTNRHFGLWMDKRKTCLCGSNKGFPTCELGGSAFTMGQTALKAISGKMTKHEKVS
ncbi:hypothetical protein HanRHA438_Chr14g0667421 [Helianthus annuus]|nr:hypothetical protein HanRHA438_Chr14g0667421 [Helianthus annuus]